MTNTDFTARCMAGKALEDVAGKQDVITDLDTIRAGAAAGATAVQPAALEDYQTKIDSTHKLDADLVDDTNSTNKFATQSQLDQIGINENNILSNSSDIASNWNSGKNKIRVGFTSKTYNTVAITNNGDGTVTINGTNSASSEGVGLADIQSDVSTMYDTRFTLPEGTYHLYVHDDNSMVFGVQVYAHNGSNANVKLIQSNTGGDFTYNNSSTYPYIAIRIVIGGAQTYDNFKIYPMICEKSVWDASHKFEQYALSNVDLTANILEKVSEILATANITNALAETFKPGTVVNGYAATDFGDLNGKYVSIATHTFNAANNRMLQDAVFQTGDRKSRYYNGTAWTAWV